MAELSKVRLHQLFQLARHLLVEEPHIADGNELLQPCKGMFGITAICLFDRGTETFYKTGSVSSDMESRARSACLDGKDADDPESGITVRCLRTGSRLTGAIAFRGLKDPEQTAEPLISLLSALYERTRLRRKLGDELKNGLTAILTAAGGMREAGPLSTIQLEMARMVEEEASRLGTLISWVERIGRLDQGEVHPRVDTADLTALVVEATEKVARHAPGQHILFDSAGETFRVLADAELILAALEQLLDYVCKHAARDSPVQIEIAPRSASVAVSVSTAVDPHLSVDREQAFGRPHRGTRVRGSSAEPLASLYQTREIAVAHGGTLDVDPEHSRPGRLAFVLSLPRANGQ